MLFKDLLEKLTNYETIRIMEVENNNNKFLVEDKVGNFYFNVLRKYYNREVGALVVNNNILIIILLKENEK